MHVALRAFRGSAAAAPSAAPHLRIILPEETPPESQRSVTRSTHFLHFLQKDFCTFFFRILTLYTFYGPSCPNETPDVIRLDLSVYDINLFFFFLDIHREQRGGAGTPSHTQRSGIPQRPAISLFQRHRRLAANPGIY